MQPVGANRSRQVTAPDRDALVADDLRNLIVVDTQYGWRGETELKPKEMQRLVARGWMQEGEENDEYFITQSGESAIRKALATPAAATGDGAVSQAVSEGPVYGIIDPDYARIFTIARTLAWSEGYALAMQGSFTRDLDLIATPWTEAACAPEKLAARIADAADLKPNAADPSAKPHGRAAWTLRLPGFGEPRWVDLSIMPRAAARDALLALIRAGRKLRNSIVETRGVAAMDEHDAAIRAAEQALATPAAVTGDRERKKTEIELQSFNDFVDLWRLSTHGDGHDVIANRNTIRRFISGIDGLHRRAAAAPPPPALVGVSDGGDAFGWIVADGQGERWRMWGDSGPEWTADRSKALRFARRDDAEAFAANDEDAWSIQPYGVAPTPPSNPLLEVARRNIRQFISKASFSSEVDRWSAGQCLDVMESAIGAAPPPPALPVVDEAMVERATQAYCAWFGPSGGNGVNTLALKDALEAALRNDEQGEP